MSQTKLSLGQAIDQIIAALEAVDADSRRTAVETACVHLKIPLAQPAPSEPVEREKPAQAADPTPAKGARAAPATDIRSLKDAKNPKSAREMACVVAFYLQELAPESERKESISTPDLEKYFKQAQFKLPTDIGQVLKDAKGSGYFDSPSRGAYKLNAVGYNLVAHKLPGTNTGP